MLLYLLFLLCACTPFSFALLEERFVAFEPGNGTVQLQDATVIYDANDPQAVQIAVKSLASDWGDITGTKAETCPWGSNTTATRIHASNNSTCEGIDTAIVVGTVNSTLVKRLIDDDKLDVSDIEGKWEAFKTSVVSNPLPGVEQALVIAGSDKRGAAFGIYTLAEQSGQSPLHFWADVPAAQHDEIYALPKTTVHGEPSVKYRGLFINDEAPALTQWWSRRNNVSDYTLDSEFYIHVFDLIVRLKGNFMWPAMWRSHAPPPGRIFFTDDPKNQQLADDYGIVMSTSHHEPMQRATNEWRVEGEGEWNWETNKDNIVDFMDEGVRRAGNNESYFTLGMRGDDDGPIVGDDPIAILEDVIETQRQLIAKHHGSESAVPQVWTVYKEVQEYYEDGLVPPEDVTLLFADDNWGNIRRLPTSEETKRKGGIGVYHHLAYVGVPKSYKWHNSNNLPKLYKELWQAHERGANQIWILNIEDIKPLELPFNFAMDMAWDMSKISFESIPDYLIKFSAREFGPELAEEAASVLYDFSHLVGMRRFEMTTPETYSHMNFHEADRVLHAWRDLAQRARNIHSQLPENRQLAFHHHALYPALAGANFHAVHINRAKNYRFALERRNSANLLAEALLDDFANDWDMVVEYEKLADGKWAGMMSTPKFDVDTESWRPASRDVLTNISYVQRRQNFDYGFGNLGIYGQGSNSALEQGHFVGPISPAFPTEDEFKAHLPALTSFGPEYVTVDLFHRGDYRNDIEWAAEVPYNWLHLSKTSGTLTADQPDQRINITVDWDAVPEDFKETFDVRIRWEPEDHFFDDFSITVLNNKLPDDFKGFPEVFDVISMEAPHFQRSSSEDVSFQHIPHLGSRSDSGSIALRPYHAAREDAAIAQAAWVEYDFYLFGEDAGSLNATLIFNSALDTDPDLPMRYAVSLDDEEPTFVRLLDEPPTAGELPEDWEEHVADNVWSRHVSFGEVEAGKHTIRFSANSPEIYLEKIVLNFSTELPHTYLGPPETRRID